MADELQTLRALLDDVSRRRTTLAWRRGWTAGAGVAAAVLGATSLLLWMATPTGLFFVTTVAAGVLASAGVLAAALRSSHAPATPQQLARLLEERHGGLDDVVVSAVDYSTRADRVPAMTHRLAATALRAVSERGAEAVVDSDSLRRAGRWALAAAVALIVAAGFFARPFTEAVSVASAYVVPSRLQLVVEPGDARVRSGQAFTIRARVRGAASALVPLVLAGGDGATPAPMTPVGDGLFEVTVPDVTASFVYHVVAGARASAEYLRHGRASAACRAHRPRVHLPQGARTPAQTRGGRGRHLRSRGHGGHAHRDHRSAL